MGCSTCPWGTYNGAPTAAEFHILLRFKQRQTYPIELTPSENVTTTLTRTNLASTFEHTSPANLPYQLIESPSDDLLATRACAPTTHLTTAELAGRQTPPDTIFSPRSERQHLHNHGPIRIYLCVPNTGLVRGGGPGGEPLLQPLT